MMLALAMVTLLEPYLSDPNSTGAGRVALQGTKWKVEDRMVT